MSSIVSVVITNTILTYTWLEIIKIKDKVDTFIYLFTYFLVSQSFIYVGLIMNSVEKFDTRGLFSLRNRLKLEHDLMKNFFL